MSQAGILCFILLSSYAIGNCFSDPNEPVQTVSGLVRGTIVQGLNNKMSRVFYGIPYAEPPVGKLRFKPPVPVSPWTEVFDATRTPLPCYQSYNKILLDVDKKLGHQVRRPWSEDCLTLNIWTPEVVPDDAPIVIFVHDGGFMTGTGAYPIHDLSTYAADVRAVAVTFNYRLGAFGFLSLGTSDAPGNLGLMDQQLALRWIHENGPAFGGKSNAIFLLGFGAGAASIGYQVILNQNEDLFKNVIVFGGSPTCSWSWKTNEKAVELGRSLARHLGCHNENISSEVECLQTIHPEDIVDATSIESLHFRPNIDGKFLKEPPTDAMKAGKFNNLTILAVNSAAEYSLFFHSQNKDILSSEDEGLTAEGFDEAMKRSGLAKTDTELDVIRDWYLNTCHTNATDIRDQAIQAISDALIVCCTSEFLDYATEGGAVTFRMVTHFPDLRFPSWMTTHGKANFPVIVGESLKISREKGYRYEMISNTLNAFSLSRIFFRNTVQQHQKTLPPYNVQDRPYFDWHYEFETLNQYRQNNCELWNNIMPKIGSRKQECQ